MQVRHYAGLMHYFAVFSFAVAPHQIRRNHQPHRFRANAGPVGHDEIAKFQQRLVFLPHRNIQKRVRPDDEIDAVAMSVVRVPEVAHRVHRIMQLRPAEVFSGLRHRRHEVRMLRAGQRHHRKTMREWRQVLLQLVRWPAGRNEVNFIEIKSPVRGSRHRKMPGVNGIKRASKQRDAARMMFYGSALRLRGGQYASRSFTLHFLTNYGAAWSRNHRHFRRRHARYLPQPPALVSEFCRGRRQSRASVREHPRPWLRRWRETPGLALCKTRATLPAACGPSWHRVSWPPRSPVSPPAIR